MLLREMDVTCTTVCFFFFKDFTRLQSVILAAPSISPPLWLRSETIKKMSIVTGDESVTAWPSSFIVVAWSQWTLWSVDRTTAFANAFAFAPIFLQYFDALCCLRNARFAQKFLPAMMFEVVHQRLIEIFLTALR